MRFRLNKKFMLSGRVTTRRSSSLRVSAVVQIFLPSVALIIDAPRLDTLSNYFVSSRTHLKSGG